VTCREFTGFIAEYLAEGLPASQRDDFERHLSRCTNCARYLEQYRRTIDMGRVAFADDESPVPADVPEDLIAAILRARRTDEHN
jgi:anti-sigma factor RsiW